jgi:prepilin-type N-terminal cleavage/methylation domain-containing protein
MLYLKPTYHARRARGGYTLVELLVAAAVLSVMIAGLVATVRFMRAEQNLDFHRRQARMAINRIFEESFDYRLFDETKSEYTLKFGTITGDPNQSGGPLKITVTNNTSGGVYLPQEFKSESNQLPKIRIDRRQGYAQIDADVTVSVKYETVPVASSTGGGKSINVGTNLVTITLKWLETGKTDKESFTLTKRLAKFYVNAFD